MVSVGSAAAKCSNTKPLRFRVDISLSAQLATKDRTCSEIWIRRVEKMKKLDAEEFLTVNKVEEGIRCAADSGAIMFAVLIEAKELNAKKPDPTAHGVVIFSIDRRRNMQMLTDIDEQFVPLGVARYIASIQNLEVRPRRRFEDRPELVKYFQDVAFSSLNDDPALAAIVREWR